ncbi:acyltransferase [Lentzea sp. PSKA42]|jgi:sugar O-acyltransferase (sialic acid O-acetyltransferase NeuD family)|uniref:Acyltransferase n=1 Tax=Lentzea indica TaxID=2604800 RepID=A0ABX1FSF6_9PSEU|nr:NeuD/PglB/VioB family sugar acetyltransferase [Lentzea indica]NKE61960.1 acyltransferase [Lentzea indica]
MTDFYIAGAGGAGREALDICVALGHEVTAFVDDVAAGQLVRGHVVCLPEEAAAGALYVVAIADADARVKVSRLLDELGLRAGKLIHPSAVIGPCTLAGDGLIVHANTTISSGAKIGVHCQVHYNATVGHDTELEDYVTVLPGANVAGNVLLETGVVVGSGAVVLQGRTVGAGASVGAGAVVTRDVIPGTVVVGSPAAQLLNPRR